MKSLKANLELSDKFADIFNTQIKAKACYDNIANIVLSYPSLAEDYPGIQVSFGGIQIFPTEQHDVDLFAKHIFFIYEDEAIEPTFAKTGKLHEKTKFIPLITYSLEEYRELLRTELETSPVKVLRAMDQKAVDIHKEENILIVG